MLLARQLGFVCYAQPALNPAGQRPQFEMNLNTGCDVEDHLGLDPGEEASHWFVLNIDT